MLFTKEASQLVRRLHDSILTCLVRRPERLDASPEVACSFTSETQCHKQTFLRDGVCSTRHSRCGTSADLRESWPVEDQAYHVARLSWRRAVALRGEKGPIASKARTHHMQLTRKVWPWLSEKFAPKKRNRKEIAEWQLPGKHVRGLRMDRLELGDVTRGPSEFDTITSGTWPQALHFQSKERSAQSLKRASEGVGLLR